MLRLHWRYALLFIMLVLIQVLILNNILLGGYMNPQLYVLFVLMLPLNTPGWLLLSLSFALGLVVDAFSDSIAIHAAAAVFIAFCRPAVLRLVVGTMPGEGAQIPSLSGFGSFSLIMYSLILIILHHTVLFFLEIFRFTEIAQTLSRIIVSSGLTLVFVVLGFALLERSFSR